MKINERQKEILEMLYAKGRVSVSELSKGLFVSEMTIRRDLAGMEKGGFLKRYRGGAIQKFDFAEMPISERLLFDKEEKEELAAKCESFLRDGISVFIDSSSTCQFIIPRLKKYKDIKVITNSVSALLAAANMHIPCFLIGGEYYGQDMCLIGSIAEEYAGDFNVDIAFFTTAAYSMDDGIISDFDINQTSIRKLIMKNSKENIFLFEAHKLGKKLLYTLCRKDEVTAIITTVN